MNGIGQGVPDGIADILEYIRRERDFETEGYCRSVLTERIQQRMDSLGIARTDAYLEMLGREPAETDRLRDCLTVKVSSFFRDPLVFEYLAEAVLPAIADEKYRREDRSLRIWSAACATGEEAYSIAMLLRERATELPRLPDPLIFATDIDESALAQARTGVYSKSSLAKLPYGLVASYFSREGDFFRVAPEIRAAVRFSRHNILDKKGAVPAESIFGAFDLILCRNLLIYFEPPWQELIVGRLWRSLVPGGFLVLGKTESIPLAWRAKLRRQSDLCPVYRKQESESQRDTKPVTGSAT